MDVSNIINIWDYILLFIYIVFIFIISIIIKNKYIIRYPEYKYFIQGIFVKCIGAIIFCLVYVYYYKGGDTLAYYHGAIALANMATYNFAVYWDILLNNNLSFSNLYSFNSITELPPRYMWKDPETFAVCRYSSLMAFLGFKSLFIMSLLTAVFSYIGLWKLFRLFNNLYPGNARGFAWAILFMPSLVFWGSGIMKDTYVLGAACWVTVNFYNLLIKRKKVLFNLFLFVFNISIILSLKPYVILSLVPGMLMWLYSSYLKQIRNTMLKVISLPFLLLLFSVVGYFSYATLSSEMGVYGDVDTAVIQAQKMQQDLLRSEAYGENSYYIGEIDGSLGNMISLAPNAIFTAIFRPMLWEVGSPMMAISAIENTILGLVFIFLIIKINPIKFTKIVFSEPILTYSIVFTLFLAFGVGIAGTNFGAMVRYKIPFMPFFFSMVYIIYIMNKENK